MSVLGEAAERVASPRTTSYNLHILFCHIWTFRYSQGDAYAAFGVQVYSGGVMKLSGGEEKDYLIPPVDHCYQEEDEHLEGMENDAKAARCPVVPRMHGQIKERKRGGRVGRLCPWLLLKQQS